MSYQFRLPDVGEGITESDLLQWHVKAGDAVREDDLLCEIETDKAVVEIPVPCTGTLVSLHAEEGTTISVGSILATFETEDNVVLEEPTPQVNESAVAPPTAGQPAPITTSGESPRAAPSTRKYARQQGVELDQLSGSGPKGRILRSDVEHQAGGGSATLTTPVKVTASPVSVPFTDGQRRTPLKGLRRAIAETMVRSVTIIPHATSGFSCSAERLVGMRTVLQHTTQQRISYTAIVMRIMALTLKQFPLFNASLDDAANEIVEHGQINIGFATHTGTGLIVPVIRHADQKNLTEISTEIDRLAELARTRKIDLADLSGGTITLSNVGSHGKHDRGGRPIVNHPEAAIIAMGRIQQLPAVVDGEVIAQQTLSMTTSYDHRLIDGVYAAQFMEAIIEIIEEPGLLLAY